MPCQCRHTSQSAILLLPILGTVNVRVCVAVRWHNDYTNFSEHRSLVQTLKGKNAPTHRYNAVTTEAYFFFLRRERRV